MSAFILKLLDESVVPVVLIFSSKIISLILTARYLGVSFSIENNRIYFDRFSGLVLANNFSNFVVLVIAVLGASLVLIRLYYFHASHIHPSFLAKLLGSDLEFAVSTSFDLFHQAAVWLSLGLVLVISFMVQALFGWTSPLVFILGLFSFLLLAVLAVLDLEREVNIETKGRPQFFLSKFKI